MGYSYGVLCSICGFGDTVPLLQAYARPEVIATSSDAPFVIAIAGEAPSSTLHTGGLATTNKGWAILAAPFVDDPCNGLGAASCGQAMALRAFKSAYDRHMLPRDDNFTLVTESMDLAHLLIRWQNGDEHLPLWYARTGVNSTLRKVQRGVLRIGRRMTVRCLPVMSLPPVGEAARLLSFIGLRYLRGDISPADQHDEARIALREAGL